MTDSPAARRGALAARALQHVLRRECDRHDAGGAGQSNGGRPHNQVPAPAARGAAGGVGEPPGLGAATADPAKSQTLAQQSRNLEGKAAPPAKL